MATVASTSLFTPLVPLLPSTKFSPTTLHLANTTTKDSNFAITCSSSSSNGIFHTEQELLEAIADYDGNDLPCLRTYENDLAQLTLLGTVDFNQALTAAAADGGEVADEHVNADMDAMVVETMNPGPSGERSTVSTRLFLPAKKVKEKAAKLKKTISRDIFSSNASRDILAMTFRQVVLQQLWNFELIVFEPGEERNMGDLEAPREVSASFALGSSDESLISKLAEAVCIAALQNTQQEFLNNLNGGNRSSFFRWFKKSKRIQSNDSSVFLYKLFEDEIVENARSLLDKYNLMKDSDKPLKTKSMHRWWKPSFYEKLEKIGGSHFGAWASEYVPTYRLEIDANIMGDAKIHGWKKSADNRWEALLTHSQMVRLAEVLDMYYVDPYSLVDKQLSCSVAANVASVSNKKGGLSLSKLLSVSLASGIFLFAVTALGQLCLPHLFKEKKHLVDHRSLPSSEINVVMHGSSDATKLEDFCTLAVEKVKDALGWSGDIRKEDGIGVYIGKLPPYLRRGEGDATLDTTLDNLDADVVESMEDIDSYQVVFSSDGSVIGFQPLSRVAVFRWAANPLTRELYGGKKLSPTGIIERGLKFSLPRNVFVVELLMSVNPDAYFAVARPFR
ncbi:hypothetical protein AAHE18_10G019700 [Arachis hypogaea]